LLPWNWNPRRGILKPYLERLFVALLVRRQFFEREVVEVLTK